MLFSKMTVVAPSNIALIKYMGKANTSENVALHCSVSMTLDDLCTAVEVTTETKELDPTHPGLDWLNEAPEQYAHWNVPILTPQAQQKVVNHFTRCRDFVDKEFTSWGLDFKFNRKFLVRSANSFPAGAGIASSASSFAALTVAFLLGFSDDPDLFKKIFEDNEEFRELVAQLSRKGSGSSCRSFFGGWVSWSGERVQSIRVSPQFERWVDLVAIVDAREKKVSSSQAHVRVAESPLYSGRAERANQRHIQILAALESGDFSVVQKLSFQEMWEMHSMFHTVNDPFTYLKPMTLEIWDWITQDKPGHWILTCDAGPNPHLLVPEVDLHYWQMEFEKRFPHLKVLVGKMSEGIKIKYC
jgi:diphosphomevalonate decarboxylase